MTAGEARHLDAALRLLDRQIIDVEGQLVAKVDDVELQQRDDGRWEVTALLTGPGVLGPRIDGLLGRWCADIWRRLVSTTEPAPGRIDLRDVREIGTAVELSVTRAEADVDGFERWVHDQVISALPGSGHAPE